jgi:hypothetical protein
MDVHVGEVTWWVYVLFKKELALECYVDTQRGLGLTAEQSCDKRVLLSGQALGPTQPSIQWVLGQFPSGLADEA